jgi:hypothetical protein
MSITCLAEGAQGAAEQAPNALRQGLGPRAPQVRGKAERSSSRGPAPVGALQSRPVLFSVVSNLPSPALPGVRLGHLEAFRTSLANCCPHS